jgi:hypothetical protein
MPVFDVESLIKSLDQNGFKARLGDVNLDVHPGHRPYYERWLAHRDGFLKLLTGNLDFIGIEEVVRMGPFFDIYCIIENYFIAENDKDAHRLLDATPYYQLENGRVTKMGWSGGVVAQLLAKDEILSKEFANNIMKEEVKKISLEAANYCCVVQTKVWDHNGLASSFGIIDRIAMLTRKLIKQVHLGEQVGR